MSCNPSNKSIGVVMVCSLKTTFGKVKGTVLCTGVCPFTRRSGLTWCKAWLLRHVELRIFYQCDSFGKIHLCLRCEDAGTNRCSFDGYHVGFYDQAVGEYLVSLTRGVGVVASAHCRCAIVVEQRHFGNIREPNSSFDRNRFQRIVSNIRVL